MISPGVIPSPDAVAASPIMASVGNVVVVVDDVVEEEDGGVTGIMSSSQSCTNNIPQ